MPSIYCMECGDKNAYSGVKPKNCKSCGEPFQSATASKPVSASKPKPTARPPKRQPKKTEQEELLAAFDDEAEEDEGYDEEFEVFDGDYGQGLTVSIDAGVGRAPSRSIKDLAGGKGASPISKQVSRQHVEKVRRQVFSEMKKKAESTEVGG